MVVRGITTRKAGKVLIINADPEVRHILEVNLQHANIEIVSAENGREALSKIHSDNTDIIILDPALPDMEDAEIYRRITESSQRKYIPIIIISARLPRKNRIANAEDIPTYHITKPFDPKEVVALVQGHLMHKERMARINPLTRLPNRIQVSKEIDKLIQQKTTFAAMYIVLHDLKTINRVYGYAEGDRVIQLLADVVSEAVCLFGNPDDLVGYFGGDKFVIISTPWKARALCRRIIADFNKRIKSVRNGENLQINHVTNKNSSAHKEETPVTSIHIALVINQKGTYRHCLEVTEAALGQIQYLSRSPESNCYFDLKPDELELSLTSAGRDIRRTEQDRLKTLQGVLDWLDFLTREINNPLNEIKNCLNSLNSLIDTNLSQQHLKSLRELEKNANHLARVIEGITGLVKSDDIRTKAFLDEVDLKYTLKWIIEQVHNLAEQKGIKVNIEIVGDNGRIIGDKKCLTQSLLYIVRSEIQSSPPESRINIRLSEKNEESIYIKITNPSHHIPARELNRLIQGQPDGPQQEILKNELYPARILLRGAGGNLEARSEQGNGTTYIITLQKKWQSWIQEIDTLQLAMEISRKEARDILKNAQNMIETLVDEVPPEIKNSYERLGNKVQELGVLGNRSLFLINDLSSRLEAQQGSLLQQEVEQLITLEAVLTICREMAKSQHINNIFNPENAKRVAKYALSIANELRMSESDREALRYAALFKDLSLALYPPKMVEAMMVPTLEEAMVFQSSCECLWRILSTIGYLSPALDFIQYRYERYDGRGGRFGVKADDIPLGARILAIADTFDLMTSGQSPKWKLPINLAMQKIAEDSGLNFDPNVVSAFLMLLTRQELKLAFNDIRGE